MDFLALAVLGPMPNSAHHTIAAHDATKTVTLTGVVMQIGTRADEWQGFGTPVFGGAASNKSCGAIAGKC